MKKLFAAATMGVFLTGAVPSLHANHWDKNPQERQKHMNDKIEKMTKEFNLTPDQQSKVRAAMQNKMEKMESAEREFHNEVKGVLNADQMKKFDEKMEEKMK